MTGSASLKFLPGELVEVLSQEEILATLDEHGDLDGMPFMPEMLAFCGRRFCVLARAHKTCDTTVGEDWTLRSMERTVHLAMLRCSGDAHGGCQAGCLLFWNEAWLKHDADDAREQMPGSDQSPSTRSGDENDTAACEVLMAATRKADQGEPGEPGESYYRCQATQLPAASRKLPWWEPTQYAKDYWYNGVSAWRLTSGLLIALYNRIQRRLGRRSWPREVGDLQRTPAEKLDLQPGEMVEVKSHQEILATIDRKGRNRGMAFGNELVPYCGGQYRVLRRVERIIEESTGRMLDLSSPSIILEDVICNSFFHRFCPRRVFGFWREIWLRRVPLAADLQPVNDSQRHIDAPADEPETPTPRPVH